MRRTLLIRGIYERNDRGEYIECRGSPFHCAPEVVHFGLNVTQGEIGRMRVCVKLWRYWNSSGVILFRDLLRLLWNFQNLGREMEILFGILTYKRTVKFHAFVGDLKKCENVQNAYSTHKKYHST